MNIKEAMAEARRLEPMLRDMPWLHAEEAAELLAWLINQDIDKRLEDLYQDHGGE